MAKKSTHYVEDLRRGFGALIFATQSVPQCAARPEIKEIIRSLSFVHRTAIERWCSSTKGRISRSTLPSISRKHVELWWLLLKSQSQSFRPAAVAYWSGLLQS